jgi:tRNA(fMet)-specific endonuclease VapC
MKFLLDSNTCIQFLNDSHAGVKRQLLAHHPSDLALCSVVKAELLYGAYRSARVVANLQRLQTFFAPMRCLPFDDACVHTYGQLRAALAATGSAIGANDMLIAAVGLTHKLTVVTHNTREFSRVNGLTLADWEILI